jgi:anti-anti-sigma factor
VVDDGRSETDLLSVSRRRDGTVAVAVRGELDLATAPRFAAGLEAAQDGASCVVVDLQAVEFMDSSGVRTLILAHRRAEAAGARLIVLNGSGPAHHTLTVTGADAYFEMADAVEELPEDGARAVEDAAGP